MVREKNLFVEFQTNSGELLRLLGEMSMRADIGKPVLTQVKDYREMVATIELFWDMTEKIFMRYEEKIQYLQLKSMNEHARAVILREELKGTYNELFKVRHKIPEVVTRIMANTALPTKEDLASAVDLKNKQQQQDGKKD
jgi:hypothetical protein